MTSHWPRRQFLKTIGIAALPVLPVFSAGIANAAEETLPDTSLDTSTVIEENGFITQDWFLESFLELSDDLSEAAASGKRLAIIWEQKGCPYCREMHMINFSTPSIREWIRERFEIVQLDIWGARDVTDFDGETMEERDLARKSRVSFTPTIQFFPPSLDGLDGKNSLDLEVARMPGYFRRFHFMTMFEYVYESAYEKDDFQRYLVNKLARIEESGGQPDVW